MASKEVYSLSPRTLQLHTDSTNHTTSDRNPVEEHQGFTIPQRAVSSSSSPRSWVMDPGDGGWHGQRASSPPPSRARQQQLHQRHLAERSRQISPSPSPMNSWAKVPLSPQSSVGIAAVVGAEPTAVEYPSMKSPPRSPGGGNIAPVAGEGLVSLAREEISSHEISTAHLDPCYIRRSHSDYEVEIYAPPPSQPSPLPSDGGVGGDGGGAAALECPEIVRDIGGVGGDDMGGMVDVSAVDVVSAGDETPAFVPPEGFDDMLAEAVVEPMVEAGATVEAPRSTGDERSHPAHDARDQPGDAETLAVDDARGATVLPSLASGESTAAAAAALTSVPSNPEVVGVAEAGGRRGNRKQLDRIWKWTGLVTAARMGVIPLIACAAVAALSTQSGGSGNSGGGGSSGGGGGSSEFGRSRGGGGGGGGGRACLPSCGERYSYGFAPMPFCAAPYLMVF